MIGFSTEDKYLMKCFQENKKRGAEQLLKMFANNKWSLRGLKAIFKNI